VTLSDLSAPGEGGRADVTATPPIDFHAQCESVVRISLKDLNGPFSYVWADHPAPGAYPGIKVASCELAIWHEGRCEMFVDRGGSPDRAHWIAWQTPPFLGDVVTGYEWLTYPDHCPANSPVGYGCNRYANHSGGHSYTVAP
jgi:hypothetical protein